MRFQRTIEVDASPEDVWEIVADPAERAETLTVVTRSEPRPDGTATWYVDTPVIPATIKVESRDEARDRPRYNRFVATSWAFDLEGEARLEPIDGRTRLNVRLDVEPRLPLLELYFRRNLPGELDHLFETLMRKLDLKETHD